MAVSREWEDFVLEQLAGLGRIRSRRMFGGVGLYLDEIFFGLIAGAAGSVYFKVDDGNRAAYVAAGTAPFQPFADRPYAMSFWLVPPEVIDSADDLTEWARVAVEAARRQRTKPRPRRDGGTPGKPTTGAGGRQPKTSRTRG